MLELHLLSDERMNDNQQTQKSKRRWFSLTGSFGPANDPIVCNALASAVDQCPIAQLNWFNCGPSESEHSKGDKVSIVRRNVYDDIVGNYTSLSSCERTKLYSVQASMPTVLHVQDSTALLVKRSSVADDECVDLVWRRDVFECVDVATQWERWLFVDGSVRWRLIANAKPPLDGEERLSCTRRRLAEVFVEPLSMPQCIGALACAYGPPAGLAALLGASWTKYIASMKPSVLARRSIWFNGVLAGVGIALFACWLATSTLVLPWHSMVRNPRDTWTPMASFPAGFVPLAGSVLYDFLITGVEGTLSSSACSALICVFVIAFFRFRVKSKPIVRQRI